MVQRHPYAGERKSTLIPIVNFSAKRASIITQFFLGAIATSVHHPFFKYRIPLFCQAVLSIHLTLLCSASGQSYYSRHSSETDGNLTCQLFFYQPPFRCGYFLEKKNFYPAFFLSCTTDGSSGVYTFQFSYLL